MLGLANSLSIYLLLLFLMIICVLFKLDVFFSFALQTIYCFILFVYDLTGVPVRAINRPGSQLLGNNGRDDGPIVSFFTLPKTQILVVFLDPCVQGTFTFMIIFQEVPLCFVCMFWVGWGVCVCLFCISFT